MLLSMGYVIAAGGVHCPAHSLRCQGLPGFYTSVARVRIIIFERRREGEAGLRRKRESDEGYGFCLSAARQEGGCCAPDAGPPPVPKQGPADGCCLRPAACRSGVAPSPSRRGWSESGQISSEAMAEEIVQPIPTWYPVPGTAVHGIA